MTASTADARTDWRFLLGGAELGRVAVDGPVDQLLRLGLVHVAASIVALADAGDGYDLAVLAAPSLATVRRAVAGLAPGGALRIEALPRRRRGRTRRLLAAAGFEVTTWWHRPTMADARCLVALDRPRAAATVLRTVGGSGRRSRLDAGLAATGLVRWAAAGTSTLAVDRAARPVARGPRARVAARAHRAGRRDQVARRRPPGPAPVAGVDGQRATALVTPRDLGSATIVGVTVTADERHLARVVKLARDPADDERVAAEAALLERFSLAAGPRAAAPANHQLGVHGGRPALIEDAATGVPLGARTIRRHPVAALAAGVRWVERMPSATATLLVEDRRAEPLLLDPLVAIAGLPTPDGRRRDDLLRRAADLLAELAVADLPTVFEHGALTQPNLFLQADGDLLAIDWAQARPDGLPLHDLTTYVAHLAETVDRPRSPGDLAAAHRRAWGPGGWADRAVRDHARRIGVGDGERPLLVLACWTRALAHLAPLSPAPEAVVLRAEVRWRTAIEDAEARP